MPKINAAGLVLIEMFEGERLRAYPDPGTGAEPWTIGFGHTANVHAGQTITHAQAVAFLKSDVANAEAAVARAVTRTLTPNQFAALVSFQYNTGAFAGSTLAQRVNAGDWLGAAAQFSRWVYAGGAVMAGLVRRRAAERALFLNR
jgi:lysozyme